MKNPNNDIPELEIKLTLRDKETGKAREYTFPRVTDAQLFSDTLPEWADLVLSFKALAGEENEPHTIIRDLEIVSPCHCYEDAMKELT